MGCLWGVSGVSLSFASGGGESSLEVEGFGLGAQRR